jgi:hypothetical protein
MQVSYCGILLLLSWLPFLLGAWGMPLIAKCASPCVSRQHRRSINPWRQRRRERHACKGGHGGGSGCGPYASRKEHDWRDGLPLRLQTPRLFVLANIGQLSLASELKVNVPQERFTTMEIESHKAKSRSRKNTTIFCMVTFPSKRGLMT